MGARRAPAIVMRVPMVREPQAGWGKM